MGGTVATKTMDKPNELYKPEPGLSRERGIDEQIAELERELGVRYRCYRQWIHAGKMSRVDAAERFERMAAALKTLDSVAATRSGSAETATLDHAVAG